MCPSCVPQENRPKGASVLQLLVTDRDASHNGPPFTFAIVDGNKGDAFHINQQGNLVAVGALNRKSKEHYLLQAQVSHGAEEKAELRGRIDLRVESVCLFSGALRGLFLSISHCLSLHLHPDPDTVWKTKQNRMSGQTGAGMCVMSHTKTPPSVPSVLEFETYIIYLYNLYNIW